MVLRVFVTGKPQAQKRPGRGRWGYFDRSAKEKAVVRAAVEKALPEEWEILEGDVLVGARFLFARPKSHFSKGKKKTLAVVGGSVFGTQRRDNV